MHGTIPAVDEVEAFLIRAKAQGFRSKIEAAFERADKLKIVFVGETIIDEYRYVLPLAKPSKEFIVASVEAREYERFQGGVLAASVQGEWASREVLTPQISLRKTRFVDADFSRKLFEVYSRTDIGLPEDHRASFQVDLIRATRSADVIVLIDFGHGLMGPQERHIAESAKFLSVNAQTNAGNAGFNPVTKYRRADYVCVDLPEARLATGMQTESAVEVIKHIEISPRVVITQGRHGAHSLDSVGYSYVPALTGGGVDTMGAGDAFLAVSAPLVAAGLDLEAAAFVGNVAGAIKVSIVGHREHVTRQAIVAKIEELLA